MAVADGDPFLDSTQRRFLPFLDGATPASGRIARYIPAKTWNHLDIMNMSITEIHICEIPPNATHIVLHPGEIRP